MRTRRIVGSTLFVVIMGSLLHFAWEWSGRNALVAIFAATSESTWEHLKLAFWPALLLAPLQHPLYGQPPGLLQATMVRTLLPSLLIVLIFYGYTALLGRNLLALDIGTFVAAVFIGELTGHAAMSRRGSAPVRAAAASLLAIAVVAFSALSFRPPAWFLFRDPLTNEHPRPPRRGIPSQGITGRDPADRGPAERGSRPRHERSVTKEIYLAGLLGRAHYRKAGNAVHARSLFRHTPGAQVFTDGR